jgi:hypothetical protein
VTSPRVLLAALVVPLATGGPVALTPTTASAEEAAVTQRLSRMVNALEVGRERPRGYEREKFVHWTDADGDGCDTRDEVLLAEAVTKPGTDAGCDLTGGEWFSWYDGEELDDSSDLDIDHVVALAEAWASGARQWTKGTRQRFANDLGDRRSLVAASASSNRSKSDRDPAEWLPRAQAHCRYVVAWVATKTRWQLRVDRSEKRAVRRVADDCRNVRVRVERARVVTR